MTTTVLLIRHETHGASSEELVPPNCLTQAARARAFRSGQCLAKLGYHISAALSSPQWRTLETLQSFLAGNRPIDQGPIPLTAMSPAFGDLLLGDFPFTPEEKLELVSAARAAGLTSEEALLALPQYAEKVGKRGREGAAELEFYMRDALDGQTIAVASHGGSRIEPMIEALFPNYSERGTIMVPPGGTVVLEFDDTGQCMSVEYLGNLGQVPPMGGGQA